MSTSKEHGASSLAIGEHFRDLPDPRIEHTKKHQLLDIIILAICAVIAGADGWEEIEAFGKDKEEWLRGFLPLPNGIPSHDTISRVFRRLKPAAFQRCFLRWIETLHHEVGLKLIAVDGKTLRRSFDRLTAKSALHLVSAWSVENQLTLGQTAVDRKSNEITAIPELLKVLELKGAIVTIDAMGCQKEIARQIVDDDGDYVLAVKDNQRSLFAAIHAHFLKVHEHCPDGPTARHRRTVETAHGREEERQYFVSPVPDEWQTQRREWEGLRSIGQVISIVRRDGTETTEIRYYIASVPPTAKKFAMAVRGHWGIENSCHWVLDVTFNEDQSRIRKDHGPDNFGWLRRMALSLIKQSESGETVKRQRKRAGWNNSKLLSILLGTD